MVTTFNSHLEALMQSDKPVMVEFFSDNSTPCEVMANVLDRFEQQYGTKVNVCRFNIADLEKGATTNKPSLFLIKDGKVAWQQKGAISSRQLQTQVAELI